MVVLTFSGYFLPGYKGGGPIKTIHNLFEQAGDEVEFKLLTRDRDLGDTLSYDSVNCGRWNDFKKSSVFYSQPGFKGYMQILSILRMNKYDLIYLNSFFSARFSIFPLLIANILNRKVVLGPRGEFSQGALALKSFKKRVFIHAFKILKLHRKIVFQASSNYEAEDIRRALGDSVDIYVAEDIGAQDFAQDMRARYDDTLKAVFVSRISPKKNLLGALKMLRGVEHPLEYHVYGPIEDADYWKQCQAVIESLPAHITAKHMGTLVPDEVVDVLSDYDVFFFPTKGENYGHVIAEALCAGLPIVIADTTPWRSLQEQGVGWDLPLDNPDAFRTVLDVLAAMSPAEHFEIRQNVLSWAKKKFSQRDAIDANIAMFKYAYEKK